MRSRAPRARRGAARGGQQRDGGELKEELDAGEAGPQQQKGEHAAVGEEVVRKLGRRLGHPRSD